MREYPDVTPRTERVLYSIVALPGRGRGLVASEQIPRGHVIEIAPVVVLPKVDAELACKTVLNDYVFTWRDPPGSMAVSLGVGSLFNHARQPNVSYTLDQERYVIIYAAARDIEPGEELCIYYGAHVQYDVPEHDSESEGEMDVAALTVGEAQLAAWIPVVSAVGPPDETLELVETWTVDLPPQALKGAFEALRRLHGRDDPLHHLKRVRPSPVQPGLTSLLLFPTSSALDPRQWLLDSGVTRNDDDSLRVQRVPSTSAAAPELFEAWSEIWPLGRMPDQRATAPVLSHDLSTAAHAWLERQVARLLEQSRRAAESGELGIACMVLDTWDDSLHNDNKLPRTHVLAHDTRATTGNTLAHSVVNAIDVISQADIARLRDGGSAYLLTGLTVLMTHEPCLFCSMSLLHSRIAHLFYLRSAPGSGGCGSVHSVHEEGNLNHRFHVWQYTRTYKNLPALDVDV